MSWPAPTGEAGLELAAVERDRLVHTIGNLTLVNDHLNPDLSNGPWNKKREGLGKHSVLFLNKELLDESTVDRWNEATILERGERLAQLAAQI